MYLGQGPSFLYSGDPGKGEDLYQLLGYGGLDGSNKRYMIAEEIFHPKPLVSTQGTHCLGYGHVLPHRSVKMRVREDLT